MSAAIKRSRNACSVPCANAGSSAPRQPSTICQRRSITVSSTASASDAVVALEQQRHAQQRGWYRLVSSARVSVHALQLLLELVVEQFVPVEPKKREQLPRPLQPFDDELLFFAQLDGGLPTLYPTRPPSGAEWRPTRADDPDAEAAVDPPNPTDRSHYRISPIGALACIRRRTAPASN